MKKVVIILTVFISASLVFAGGVNRLGGLGPKAGGMSGAFTAVADDASAFYYNPAGLTQIKSNYIFVGGDLVLPHFQYQAPMSSTLSSKNDVSHLMPLFGFSAPVSEKFAFGLGVISPYGLGASYSQMESLLTLTDLVPAVCWQVTDELSLGAALNLGWSQFEYDAPITVGGLTVGFSKSEATGSGVGAPFGAFETAICNPPGVTDIALPRSAAPSPRWTATFRPVTIEPGISAHLRLSYSAHKTTS